jgi:hypothetical protein
MLLTFNLGVLPASRSIASAELVFRQASSNQYGDVVTQTLGPFVVDSLSFSTSDFFGTQFYQSGVTASILQNTLYARAGDGAVESSQLAFPPPPEGGTNNTAAELRINVQSLLEDDYTRRTQLSNLSQFRIHPKGESLSGGSVGDGFGVENTKVFLRVIVR